MPSIPYLNPLQQQVIDTQNLLNRVQNLEQRNPSLPMLNADPGASSGINMWILTDGRIHVRLPNGTVKEVSPGASTGSSSTSPVTPPVPTQTFVQSWYPTWTQTYSHGGSAQTPAGANLYFGTGAANGSGSGQYGAQMSILAFPSSMSSQLSGASINYIHLWLTNINTSNNAPSATVHVGGGSYSGTAPSTYISSFENEASATFSRHTVFKVVLPVYFYAPFTGGAINGLTLNAPNSSGNNYGEVMGGGGYTGGVRLEISYTN